MKNRRGVQRIESEEPVEEMDVLAAIDSENELSLEELSAAYSKLLGESTPSSLEVDDQKTKTRTEEDLDADDPISELDKDTNPEEVDACSITGKSILEAILFVGHAGNEGVRSESVSAMMRGVHPSEIDEWIVELNQQYAEQDNAMRIVHDEGGYRMQLPPELHSVRDSMYGKLRETQLNQAAIDCLSLVAYRPGATREEIEQLWGRPAVSVLSLLVRRELARVEREGKGKQPITRYYPTERFLNLLGIASLDDLPVAESEF
ncbi:MAG: SMC-Scp complex subunit ScpB [Pirellulaceae bacterium]|nr:SMC-Scp complex subunit ScpB [Pirellulaceae bacterium]